jgi:hypothetical protein
MIDEATAPAVLGNQVRRGRYVPSHADERKKAAPPVAADRQRFGEA